MLDVQKTDTGYSWDFIDSNEPLEVHHQDYHYGQTHIKTSSGTGVPYLQMNEDLDVYPGLIEKYCGH